MRKYVLLNRDPPYDSEKLAKGLLVSPGLLLDTEKFRMKIIDLVGAGYKDEMSLGKAMVRSDFVDFFCGVMAERVKKPDIVEEMQRYCSNITSIANIKYQMGSYYFKSSAVPKFLSVISNTQVEDPLVFIENAPDIARCTAVAYNIVISEYYAARYEAERLEQLALAGLKEDRIVWDSTGAGVTLPYAVSMLKIGSCIMQDYAEMNRVSAVFMTCVPKDDTCIIQNNGNFYTRVASRTFDIRSVYTNYSIDEIEKEAALSPVKIGELPSDREIILALAEISQQQESIGQIPAAAPLSQQNPL